VICVFFFYSKTDGYSQCLEILDTSGSYEFPAMKELHIRCSAACLLLFDLTNTNSLNSLIDLYATIERIKGMQFDSRCWFPYYVRSYHKPYFDHQNTGNNSWQIVLVGNKCDITADEKTREVSKEASLLAENSFKCPYYESSAKANINIDILFQSLAENINDQAKMEMRLLRTASTASSYKDSSGQRRNTLTLARRFSLLIPKSNQIRRFSAPIASNSNEKLSQISIKPKTSIRSKRTTLPKNCVLS
jgi:GTPase SAR1 family protein